MGKVKNFANWQLYILEKVSGKKRIRYNWGLYLYEFIATCIYSCIAIPIYLIIYPFKKILNIKFT